MSPKPRLDQLLVERGLLRDVRTAAAWIMARKVRVAGQYLTTPGTRLSRDVAVEVLGLERRYVSRGGEKLEAALERFAVPVKGRVVLDAGASTGGFTDCLLQRGAARVYAVDAGHGQLRGSLAADPRVVALERTNISSLAPEQLSAPLDLCVADLSYLSVEKSLPILASLFVRSARIVHLIKPLFEGLRLGQTADREAVRGLFERLAGSAERCGLVLTDLMVSPVRGSRGTSELFALFSKAARSVAPSRELLARVAAELGRDERG